MSSIVVAGLTPDWKVPIAAREVNFGRGRRSIGTEPVRVLVTGNKLTGGSATVETPVQIFSEEDADTQFGAGSEIAIQCYHALAIGGVTLWGCPVAEAGGATAATLTATVGGSWTTTGTIRWALGGKVFSATVTPAMSTANVATAIANNTNAESRLFCTASPASAVATFTTRSKGARMNKWIARVDLTDAPAGLTLVLAGGTALTGGITPFTSGAGADDVTNALAALISDRWQIQAWAQADATNAALIRTQLNSEASGLIMHYEHSIMALNGTTSASMSFASTTLNNQRMTVVHLTNSETHPSAMAAQLAAIRATTIGQNPNARYNKVQCPTLAPQSQKADIPSLSVQNSLLNSGVLPLITTRDGRVLIVRAIQSHCLNGSSPDFRTLDWGMADTPDRVSDELDADWEVHSAANAYVVDDPAEGAETPASGKTYPRLWNAQILFRLKICEAKNWLMAVDTNLPLTVFQTDHLMSAVPCVVALQNHIVGIQVNQTSLS